MLLALQGCVAPPTRQGVTHIIGFETGTMTTQYVFVEQCFVRCSETACREPSILSHSALWGFKGPTLLAKQQLRIRNATE